MAAMVGFGNPAVPAISVEGRRADHDAVTTTAHSRALHPSSAGPDLTQLAGAIAGQNVGEHVLGTSSRVTDHAGDLPAALATMGVIAWGDGRLVDAVGLLRTAVSLADAMVDRGRRCYARLPLALLLATIGEFALADAEIAQCRGEITRCHDGNWEAAPMVCCAFVGFASGRTREAAAQIDKAAAIAARHQNVVLLRTAATVRDLVELHRRDASLLTGEPRVGRAPLLLAFPDSAAALVRLALDDGDRDFAAAIVVQAECAAAENFGLRVLETAAWHARGLLEGNIELLLYAASEHRHPFARASSHEDAGTVFLISDRDAARTEFECALTGYEQIGAGYEAARVRERLRDASVPSPGRRRNRPRLGWASLTDTEARVARVVAEGLTNGDVAGRMFLSRHTVDFHLRQIYRKLGIRSRVELTRLVVEHEA